MTPSRAISGAIHHTSDASSQSFRTHLEALPLTAPAELSCQSMHSLAVFPPVRKMLQSLPATVQLGLGLQRDDCPEMYSEADPEVLVPVQTPLPTVGQET